MKLRRQKETKLKLINILSHADVKIISYSVENDFDNNPSVDVNGYLTRKYNGNVKYIIDIYDARLLDFQEII